MKVRLLSEEQPDVVITISWKEAAILRTISDEVSGLGPGRVFMNEVGMTLNNVGVPLDNSTEFSGCFK